MAKKSTEVENENENVTEGGGTAADTADTGGQADLSLGIKARVLLDCNVGRADDVVELDKPTLKAAKETGLVDDHPDAVKHAEALKAAKTEKK